MLTITNIRTHHSIADFDISRRDWQLALTHHGAQPEHYMDANRYSMIEDQCGRELEFRFVPYVHDHRLRFRAYANRAERRHTPTHEAIITADFNDTDVHQDFYRKILNGQQSNQAQAGT